MKTVLVTGAAGFIGQTVCATLVEEGFTVYGVVRPETFVSLPKGVQKIEEDLFLSTNLSILPQIDVLIHLAQSPYGPKLPFMRNAREALKERCLKMNIDHTGLLAGHAAKAGIKQFLFISTAQMMGSYQNEPYTDLYTPKIMEENLFAYQKFEAEKRLQAISNQFPMSVTVLRVPLVYGPRMKGRFVKLLQSIQKKVKFPFGHLQNVQSLLFVQNLADAMVAVIHKNPTGFGAYLLADPEPISAPNVVRTLAHALEFPDPVIQGKERKFKLMFTILGKKRALQRLTGSFIINSENFQYQFKWRPRYTTQEGLKIFARWFQNS